MRRFTGIAALTLFALAISGLSQSPQTSPRENSLRRFQVSARTVLALASGKKYVVDLTQRGVKYEFDSKSGQIDFSRIVIRTARGDVTMASFLDSMIPKDSLTWFKYSSHSFSVQTVPGTVRRPPTMSPTVGCYTGSKPWCQCHGEEDCEGMIKYMGVCKEDTVFCAINPLTGEKFCSCVQKSQT
jgi:hypothetical protein